MYESSSAASFPATPPPAPDAGPRPVVLDDTPWQAPGMSRSVSLGGVVPRLPAFTLGSRLHGRGVLTDTDLTPDEIGEVLETATRLKRLHHRGEPHAYLPGTTLGMVFQHPSTRTRVAFEAGMAQLGGQAIFLGVNDLQLKRGETLADTARVLSRYVDALVARVTDHGDLDALAASASIPVFNGLSDRCHPLQALSDLLTLQERFGTLAGLKVAYLGDGNNVASSLLLAGSAIGVGVTLACPEGFGSASDVVTQASWLAAASGSGAQVVVTADPYAAVAGADAVYTDVHVSMGQTDGAARAVALAPYKITADLMAAAKPSAVFMHCLPMHRGEEVDAVVADGPQSIIFDQAENRLHLQKALLLHALCRPGAAAL